MTTRGAHRVLAQQQQNIHHFCQRVQEGDETAVQQILSQSPDLINTQDDSSGLRPLHVAARYNQPNIVGILLDKGAEINATSRDQELTALHIAARLIDRKRLAAEEQSEAAEQLQDQQDDFLKIFSQENDVAPAPPPTTSTAEQTTTERLMNHPDIDPNICDRLGETPLHYAARWGNAEECQILLNAGRNVRGRKQIDVNVKDKDGMTPLHHVCLHMCSRSKESQSRNHGETRHYHEIASQLIRYSANILATDNNGNTPLHLAADEGCKEVTEELLEAAASAGTRSTQDVLAVKNSKGDTALNVAVRRDYYEVTRHILSRGTNEIGVGNKDGDTPLHNCKHTGIFRTLLDNWPDINAKNKDGATPLHLAAKDGRLQILVEFGNLNKDQRQGLDEVEFFNCTDNDDRTPLLIASQYGRNAIVTRLLKNKAVSTGAKDKDGKTALFLAAENNHVKVLEAMFDGDGPMLNYLEESGTDKLQTPLHIAAINGHLDIVKLLIQNGAQVRAKHHGGKTPLHLACQYGQYNVVRELVTYESAAIHDTSDQKQTPLHSAALWGHFGIVQFLVENKTHLDAVTDVGETALYLAAKKGWDKTCHVLIDSGADVTIEHKSYQKTPLQIACQEGHVKVAEILLQFWRTMMEKSGEQQKLGDGTVPVTDWRGYMSQRDCNGKNCLDLAIENGHEEIAEMIVETEGAWKFVLKNCDPVDPSNPVIVKTPMRKLIRYMPGVAEAVFNKCISNGATPGQVRFDYTYLDDQNERQEWMQKSEQNKTVEDEQRSYKTYKKTHVLTVLAKSEKMELLSHPLVSALLRKKSRSCAMYIFYLQLFVYLIFLAFLTAFMVSSIPPYQFATDYPLAGNGTTCEQVEAGGHRQPGYSTALQYITLLFSAVLLISEVIQLYQKKKGYFEFDNLIEWIIFIFAIIVTIDFTPCSDATGFRYTWQWSIGTASLFFGWINLALYLQKFPTIGIYIMMFKDILNTFLEFVIVYVLFVIAFALAFYNEIRSIAAYKTFGLSFVKTAVMMIGEFDYGDDFVGADLHNTAAVYILFVCFMIVMTILVMNLLVGLAVDDIKEIQNKANLKRLQMQIDLVLDLESVVQVGLCCKTDGGLTEEIYLEKPRKLPFNLNNYIGKESFGLTLEAIERAKNPEKSEVGKIQEEQQNLRQQNDKLKERLKEQADMLKSLDETLKLVLERLPEPQR